MKDGFDKARAAFNAYASTDQGVAVDALTTVPLLETLTGVFKVASGPKQIDPRINDAFAFQAAQTADRQKHARGWALPDGTVITAKQNLGALLTAAGFGTDGGMPVDDITARLIWSFGPPHVPADDPAEVDLKADGSGTIRFKSRMVIPGGPKRFSQFVITRAADGSAQLSVVK